MFNVPIGMNQENIMQFVLFEKEKIKSLNRKKI